MKRYGQNPCTLGRVLQRFLQLVWLASLAMRRGAPCLQRTQRGLLPSCCQTARLGSTCVSPLHQISRRPASAGYTAGLPLCGGLSDAPVAKGCPFFSWPAPHAPPDALARQPHAVFRPSAVVPALGLSLCLLRFVCGMGYCKHVYSRVVKYL